MGDRVAARVRSLLARAGALLILALGALAVIYPTGFVAIVSAMQTPPALYFAAALRFSIGVTFLAAARGSRASLGLYFLGGVMTIGGLVTPVIGQGLARPILDAWTYGGDGIVRGWGVASLVLGGFARWALGPREPFGTAEPPE